MLSTNNDAKTVKGLLIGILTGILYLAPLLQGLRKNVCPFASEGCAESCLYTAGRGRMSNVQKGRIRKTQLFYDDPETFFRETRRAIGAVIRKAEREGLTPAIRLNGTSDLPWESLKDPVTGKTLVEHYPDVQFYDYTKNFHRMVKFCAGDLPNNYHLTFSRSETNDPECQTVLKHGGTVAVVFKRGLPDTWIGYPVVSGDDTDVRFHDAPGTVIGLTAKGSAKHDDTGFVVDSDVMLGG